MSALRTSAVWALAASAALLLPACAPRPTSILAIPAAPAAAPPQIIVLQADVIVVDGRHLRLVGAVTPQPAPRAHCAAEAVAARQARSRLREMAQGVGAVTVIPTGKVDRWDRTEAQVFLDATDPAQVLVDEGLAVSPGGKPFDWCGPLSSDMVRSRHIAMLSL